jgi:hypothetical protein
MISLATTLQVTQHTFRTPRMLIYKVCNIPDLGMDSYPAVTRRVMLLQVVQGHYSRLN